MKKISLNPKPLMGLLMLLTILFVMPQGAQAQNYKLEGDYVKFQKFVQPNPEEAGNYVDATEAAAGDQILVYIDYDADFPQNYYPTGDFSSSQVTVEKIYDDGRYTGSGHFTMPAQNVTVNGVVAAQEEYVVDLSLATSQVIPQSMWILLYSLDYGNEDPESPKYNVHDDAGHRYLDLNLDGKNDLQVIEDQTSNVPFYTITRLSGADGLYNCRFGVSYVTPLQYNSVYFRFPPHALQAGWINLSDESFTYTGQPIEPTVTVMDGSTPVAVTLTYSNNTNAGEATVTVTANAEGYTGSVTKTFTISRKALLLVATPQTITEGEETPTTFTGTVEGFVEGEGLSDQDQLSFSITNPAPTKAGSYAVTGSLNGKSSGDYGQNYTFSNAKSNETAFTINIKLQQEQEYDTYDWISNYADGQYAFEDGSILEIHTDEEGKIYATINHKDGSKTEIVKQTVTDADGNVTENTTVTVTDAYGNVTETIITEDSLKTDPNSEEVDQETGEIFCEPTLEQKESLKDVISGIDIAIEKNSINGFKKKLVIKKDAFTGTRVKKMVAKNADASKYKLKLAGKAGKKVKVVLSKKIPNNVKAKINKKTKKYGIKVIYRSRGFTDSDPDDEYIESGDEIVWLEDCDLVLTFDTSEEDITIDKIEATDYIEGDANNDGKVDAADLVEMINAKAGKASERFNLPNADIDRDGEITQNDIDAVVKLIMNPN